MVVVRKSLLEKELSEASQQYYSTGLSKMSDAEFDLKLKELKSIDPNSKVVTSVGHGYDVLNSSTYGKKEEHRYGLVSSLEKCHNWKEVPSNVKNQYILASLKLDGLSCVLYYEQGKLVRALTRGDGSIGINITSKVAMVEPRCDQYLLLNGHPFTGAIRGELLMKLNDFKRYAECHEDAKNPRNTTAGIINRKNASQEDLSYISLVCYSIVGCDNLSKYAIYDYCDAFECLEKHFEVAPWHMIGKIKDLNFDECMFSVHNSLDFQTYPQDGLVLACLPLNYNAKSGQVTWNSCAYKFPSEIKQTEVIGVEWNLSKTGYYVPRIKFNPVELCGSSVSYATAFNAKYVKDSNLQKGSIVSITKSGEVIPYIVSVDSCPSIACELPKTCSSCGSELAWASGDQLQCKNPDCPGTKHWNLLWWIKNISPIDGISDSLLDKYLSMYDIDSISDIYFKTEFSNRMFSETNTFSTTSKQESLFRKCMRECIKGDVVLDRAIRACNIPRFGVKTSKQCFPLMDCIMRIAQTGQVSTSDFERIKVLGEANANSLASNVEKLSNLNFLSNIYAPALNNAKGKVCVTGKLSMKRKDFEKILQDNGFEPVSSVSKDTFALVTNEKDSNSSKSKQANKYHIQKLSEQEFIAQYMGV